MADKGADKKAAAKPAAAKPARAKSEAAAKPAASASGNGAKPKSTAAAKAAAVVSTRGACTAEKCQRPLRAKGYCRKHFLAWRRGILGIHHRYKVCSKEGCRKRREHGGLCAEHAGKGEAAPPATPAAS